MKKTKLAIFDCDGVLFDSREANRHYYNAVLHEVGLPPMDEKQLDYCHSHTASESLDFLLKDQSETIVKEARQVIGRLKYDKFLKYMSPEPGMYETVKNLKKIIPTAISTNRSTTMPLLVEMYDLNLLFDKIVCALDVRRPKPDPEGVFMILSHFNIEPEFSVYIGDTWVDAKVANAAGVPFIAYKNRDLDAMFHVEHFSEIEKIISEST